MYGNIGVDDVATIDGYVARLPKNGVVVNLGCGPNTCRQLHNLAATLARLQWESTLILADSVTGPIKNVLWIPGPRHVHVVTLNAATATEVLGPEQADLVLAFGLFGDLSASTTPQGGGKIAWAAVLTQCFRLLRPQGHLIVSNSCDRQPFDEFTDAVKDAGFAVRHHHESASYWSQSEQERRYLIVCGGFDVEALPNGRLHPTPQPRS